MSGTNVVIAGASVYGLDNLSDDAMFKAFCDGLHEVEPDVDIVLLARHPGERLDAYYGLQSIKNLDHNSRAESRGRWYNGLNNGDDTKHLSKIWEAIGKCDVFVIGGEPFIDISIGLYKGLKIQPYSPAAERISM